MILSVAISAVRGFLDDKAGKQLWTDDELVRAINWALNKIYRDTKIIRDSSSGYLQGITIAFVDGGAGNDSITDSLNRFLLTKFSKGDTITIRGSTSNNGTYTILSVVAGTIEVATGSLTAEIAGDTVQITNGLTRIPITAGIGDYTLDSRVVGIVDHSVRLVSTGAELIKTTKADMDNYVIDWETTEGTVPTYYLLDKEVDTLTIYPILASPNTDMLRLTVIRLPLKSQSIADRNTILELNDRWEDVLVDGALSKLYRKQDVETFNPVKSASHEKAFVSGIDEIKMHRLLSESTGNETVKPRAAFL